MNDNSRLLSFHSLHLHAISREEEKIPVLSPTYPSYPSYPSYSPITRTSGKPAKYPMPS